MTDDCPSRNPRLLPKGMEPAVYDERVAEAMAILSPFLATTMTPKLSAHIFALLAPLEARWEEENALFEGNMS